MDWHATKTTIDYRRYISRTLSVIIIDCQKTIDNRALGPGCVHGEKMTATGAGLYDRVVVALDRAWRSLVTVLDSRAGLAQEDQKTLVAAADAVSDFAANHPDALEAHVATMAREVVKDWGGQRCSALFGEVRDSARGQPYARVLAALSPDGLVKAFAALWRFDRRTADLCAGRALEGLVRRARAETLGALELPPEAYDALHALAGLAPLPDILPPDVTRLKPTDVDQLFEIYTAMPIAELEQRLRGHGHLRGRFLADGESLGRSVLRDAQWLARRHIDRHALATALMARFDRPSAEGGSGGTLLVSTTHLYDPFHTIDVYPVHGRGTADLRVGWLPRKQIPSLAIETIRRGCFFASGVTRADPSFLSKWLELR
jgi:hypothetical protein